MKKIALITVILIIVLTAGLFFMKENRIIDVDEKTVQTNENTNINNNAIEKNITENTMETKKANGSGSIKILTPKGGEVYNPYTAQSVSWSFSGMDPETPITVGFIDKNGKRCDWDYKTFAKYEIYTYTAIEISCLKMGEKYKASIEVDGTNIKEISEGYFTIEDLNKK